MKRFGSMSRFRGASRLLLTDRGVRGAAGLWRYPLVPTYRELLPMDMPLNPP